MTRKRKFTWDDASVLLLVVLIGISIFIFSSYYNFNIVVSILFGLCSGFFASLFIVVPITLIKRTLFHADTKAEIAQENLLGEKYINPISQYDADIDVIVSFGKSLENLPEDRLPKESDLEYPIARIQEAIDRLKLNPSTPQKLKQALLMSESSLLLFKS
jgi:hypothetical protein